MAMALNAKGGAGRMDGESETLIPIQEVGKRTHSGGTGQNGCGIGNDGDPMFSLLGSAQHAIAHSLRATGFDASEDGTGRGIPLVADTVRSHPRPGSNSVGNIVAFNGRMDPVHGAVAGALDCDPATQCVAFQESQSGCREYAEAGSLRAHGPGHDPVGTRVRDGMAVRRLTPAECEALMGFPRDYTLIPYRGKPAVDGPRYRALGNSMAVPVMRWIGERIAAVEDLAW